MILLSKITRFQVLGGNKPLMNNTNVKRICTTPKTVKKTKSTQLKKYKKPTLKNYGEISDLVFANMNLGSDGGGRPMTMS